MISALGFVALQILTFAGNLQGQTTNGCTEYFRNSHRMGPNVMGRLEIPTDELYPKYKLKVVFSSPIHHMTIRHIRAKDLGAHREFIVDPMESQQDGKLKLDVFIRLQRLFGPTARIKRIVYNNLALCGDPVDESEYDDSFAVALTTRPTSPKPSPLPILVPINNTILENKDYEDENDIF